MDLINWLDRWSDYLWPLLFDHLWQTTLIFGLVFAAAYLLKQAPARARYGVCLIASAKLLIPSIALAVLMTGLGLDPGGFISRHWTTHPAAISGISLARGFAAPVAQIVAAGATQSTVIPKKSGSDLHPFYLTLTAVWFSGFLIITGVWLKKRIGLAFLLKYVKFITAGPEADILARLTARMGISRPVQLAITPVFIEPGVWRIRRPVILLPQMVFSELTESEFESILMHELNHVKRWDNLFGDLHMFLCCLFWFHPLVWLLDRKLLAEREQACDEDVVRLGAIPDAYLGGILKVKQFCLKYQIAGVSYATGSSLKNRMESIMSNNDSKRFSGSHRAMFGAVLIMTLALSAVAGSLGRTAGAVPQPGLAGTNEKNDGDLRDALKQFKSDSNIASTAVNLPYQNVAGTPLSIVAARGILLRTRKESKEKPGAAGQPGVSDLTFDLVNTSDKQIVEIALDSYGAGSVEWVRLYALLSIGPRATYAWDTNQYPITKAVESLDFWISAIRFADGSVWGSFDPPLLPDHALVKALPVFPAEARDKRIRGLVVIELTVNENGDVESAHAVAGHPELMDAAVQAAYKWKWKPFTDSDGKPVKQTGTLVFDSSSESKP